MRTIKSVGSFLGGGLFAGAIFALGLISGPQIDGTVDRARAQQSIGEMYQERKRVHNLNTVTIMAAGISGTYAPFAQDLQTVLDEPDQEGGLRILPVLGLGGGANVLDILFLEGVDMGITQQEHLEFFRQRDPELHARIHERVHYITKLYNSEYHLLARKDIERFEDLRGEKVAFYKNFSATDIAGRTIFRMLDIDVEPVYTSLKSALDMLRNGEVAGVTYLAGAPVSGYKTMVEADDNFHFVPLSPATLAPGQFEKLLEVFLPTQLTHDTYPDLVPEGQPVATVASGAVLAVYNWSEGSERYNKVANFVQKFFDSFDRFLKSPRHPKWKEVNLAAEIPGWTRFKPAQEWLDRNRATASTEVKEQFDEFLQETAGPQQLSEEQKDALFTEFVKWRQSRNSAEN